MVNDQKIFDLEALLSEAFNIIKEFFLLLQNIDFSLFIIKLKFDLYEICFGFSFFKLLSRIFEKEFYVTVTVKDF